MSDIRYRVCWSERDDLSEGDIVTLEGVNRSSAWTIEEVDYESDEKGATVKTRFKPVENGDSR